MYNDGVACRGTTASSETAGVYAMVVDKHIELIVVCVSVVDAIEVCVAIL